MSTLPELLFSAAYNVLVAAISIYAFTIIYQLCVSLGTIMRLVRRMKWPNLTLKFVQHPRFFQTLFDNEEFLSVLHDVTRNVATFEHETCFGMFGSTVFLLTYSGDYAQAILTSPHCMNKSDRYSPIQEGIGESLITAPGSEYRAARKIVMPIFHKPMVATFMPLFNKHILATASQLEKHVNKEEFVVESYVQKYVFKCAAEFVFGVPMSDGEIDKLIHLAYKLSTSITTNIVRWLKVPGFIQRITPAGRANAKFWQELDILLLEAIRRRADVLAEKNAKLENKIESLGEENDATKKILLDILIDPERKSGGNTFSELKIFLEAHKVYEELYDIYGSTTPEDVPVVLNDHQRMPCLERVIKETMRLFPSARFIARSVEEDIIIGDQTIPKGCDACIFIYGMHRSEKYWPDPLKFDPDRFLPENIKGRPPCVYLPFSEGPRKCPGYTMALAIITQFLATTLRKYIVSSYSVILVKDIKTRMKLSSSFIEPGKIKIQRRQPIGSVKSTAGER